MAELVPTQWFVDRLVFDLHVDVDSHECVSAAPLEFHVHVCDKGMIAVVVMLCIKSNHHRDHRRCC
jgi:hypothetical protein